MSNQIRRVMMKTDGEDGWVAAKWTLQVDKPPISSQVSCNKWLNLGFLHKCHATSDDKWQIRLAGMSCTLKCLEKSLAFFLLSLICSISFGFCLFFSSLSFFLLGQEVRIS